MTQSAQTTIKEDASIRIKGFIISHFMVTLQGNILKICIMNNYLSFANQKITKVYSSVRYKKFE